MTADSTDKTTVELRILGPLEIAVQPGGMRRLPTSLRARYILVIMAVEPEYGWREFIDLLWPDEAKNYDASRIRRSLNNRLYKELMKARQALELDRTSKFLHPHGGTVIRVFGDHVSVVSDFDEFHRLSASNDATDWHAALALVRGVIAARLPDDGVQQDWLDQQRQRQLEDISAIVARLHPNATATELDTLSRTVLDGRYDFAGPPSSPLPEIEPSIHQPGAGASQPQPGSRRTKRWRLASALAAGAVAAALAVVFASGGHKTASVPPVGAIVNTWTGKWSLRVPAAKASLAQISGGTATFVACNISARRQCRYLPSERTIHASIGDIIEFKDFLYDPQDEPVPYVKLWVSAGPAGKHASEELGVQILVAWPGQLEPEYVQAGNYGDLTIRLPTPGAYHLTYSPGSTILTSPYNRRLMFHLPDGVMEEGIGLEDLGSPPSCFQCAPAYSRVVSFRAKIT